MVTRIPICFSCLSYRVTQDAKTGNPAMYCTGFKRALPMEEVAKKAQCRIYNPPQPKK